MFWNFNDLEFVIRHWPEAEYLDNRELETLLATAYGLCVAYAPALSEGESVPDSWRLAEVITARDIWSRMAGGNREEIGPDGMVIPTAPLIFLARDLLRPRTSPLGRLR